jgi:hypothetical protein
MLVATVLPVDEITKLEAQRVRGNTKHTNEADKQKTFHEPTQKKL